MTDLGLSQEEAFKLAEADFKEANIADTKNSAPIINLGALAAERGDVGMAKAYFDAAIAIDKNNPDIVSRLGAVAEMTGDYVTAARLYGQAAELAQESLEKSKYLMQKALALTQAGSAELAKSTANEAMVFAQKDTRIAEMVRVATLLGALDFEEATKVLPHSENGNQDIMSLRMKCIIESKRERKLSDACGGAIALDRDDAASYVARCSAYISLGMIQLAIADCDQGIKLDPKNAYAYLERARAQMSSGNVDAALSDLEKAETNGNKTALLKMLRAVCYLVFRNDMARALTNFDAVIENEALGWLARYGRSEIYSRMGRNIDAIADLSSALEKMPNDVYFARLREGMYNRRGILYRSEGKYYEAVDDFGDAVKIDPDDKFNFWNVCITYNDLDKLDDVVASCTEVIKRDPEFADAYAIRGAAYSRLGRIDLGSKDFIKRTRILQKRSCEKSCLPESSSKSTAVPEIILQKAPN